MEMPESCGCRALWKEAVLTVMMVMLTGEVYVQALEEKAFEGLGERVEEGDWAV